MGIDAKCLVFLSKISNKNPLGRCITLGRQQLFIEPHLLSWASKTSGVPKNELETWNGQFAEEFLMRYFGASEVVSLDVFPNDQPTLLHDMNMPIPQKLEGGFDAVLDIGTSEHIFSSVTVFENVKNLCKKDGFIVHYVPGNNMCGHGLYQFSPTLFQSIYYSEFKHGYGNIYLNFQNDERAFFKLSFDERERINICFGGRMNQFVFVRNNGKSEGVCEVQQMDYLVQAGASQQPVFAGGVRSFLKKIRFLRVSISYLRSTRIYASMREAYLFRRYSERIDISNEVFRSALVEEVSSV